MSFWGSVRLGMFPHSFCRVQAAYGRSQRAVVCDLPSHTEPITDLATDFKGTEDPGDVCYHIIGRLYLRSYPVSLASRSFNCSLFDACQSGNKHNK